MTSPDDIIKKHARYHLNSNHFAASNAPHIPTLTRKRWISALANTDASKTTKETPFDNQRKVHLDMSIIRTKYRCEKTRTENH